MQGGTDADEEEKEEPDGLLGTDEELELSVGGTQGCCFEHWLLREKPDFQRAPAG